MKTPIAEWVANWGLDVSIKVRRPPPKPPPIPYKKLFRKHGILLTSRPNNIRPCKTSLVVTSHNNRQVLNYLLLAIIREILRHFRPASKFPMFISPFHSLAYPPYCCLTHTTSIVAVTQTNTNKLVGKFFSGTEYNLFSNLLLISRLCPRNVATIDSALL